jgi:hypothetical protein
LWPVTSQAFNVNGESDYSNGFMPHYPLDELSELSWLPLSHPNEYMVKNTLSLINLGFMPATNGSRSCFTDSIEMPEPKVKVLIHN